MAPEKLQHTVFEGLTGIVSASLGWRACLFVAPGTMSGLLAATAKPQKVETCHFCGWYRVCWNHDNGQTTKGGTLLFVRVFFVFLVQGPNVNEVLEHQRGEIFMESSQKELLVCSLRLCVGIGSPLGPWRKCVQRVAVGNSVNDSFAV